MIQHYAGFVVDIKEISHVLVDLLLVNVFIL